MSSENKAKGASLPLCVFDVSKKPKGNPKENLKKMVKRLKEHFKCVVNNDEIKYDKIKKAHALIVVAPTEKYNKKELEILEKFLDDGKKILIVGGEGGELKLGTNINVLLDKYGIFMNDDVVIRTSYYKYFNPKELFVQNGVVDEEFVRVANGQEKQKLAKKNQRLAIALDDDDDDNSSGLGGFHFVYPFGCTFMVNKPAIKILTSGPISYPVNKALCAMSTTKKGGQIIALGSWEMIADNYLDKEENSKLLNFIKAIFLNEEFEPNKKENEKEEPEEPFRKVPDIAEMSETLKPCLQDSEDLPKDATKLFESRLFNIDLSLVPETIRLFKEVNVKQAPLTLIPPNFEAPMLGIVPAVFPPILGELPPPRLELFDLDDEFADQNAKMAQLTNKSTNADLDYYIRECANTMGLREVVDTTDSRKVLTFMLKQLINFKKNEHL